MRTRSFGLAVIVALGIPVDARAQSGPCFVQLVPNPGFESVLFNPWVITGSATALYQQHAVNNVTTSQCISVTATGDFTVTQPTSFSLTGGVTYEFALDVWTNDSVVTVDLGITGASGRTSLVRTNVLGGRTRIATLFTPAQTGTNVLDFLCQLTNAPFFYRFDNVLARPNPMMLTFDGVRAQGASNTMRIQGTPNSNFTVFLGATGVLPAGFPVPTCGGAFWVNPPAYALFVGSLDPTGKYTTTLRAPAGSGGFPLVWQPVALPPACGFGCPVTIGF